MTRTGNTIQSSMNFRRKVRRMRDLTSDSTRTTQARARDLTLKAQRAARGKS